MPAAGPVAQERGPASEWLSEAGGSAVSKAPAENFPVALRLLPARYRRHLMAVYVFARTTDDAGDLAPPDQRLGLLGELADDVRRLYAASAQDQPRLAAVRGLAGVVAECGVPIDLFLDLIRANEQDQSVTRYDTYAQLLDYCRLSANPVGRIVLHVFGVATEDRAELSDSVCTGLQIAEHLQDVAEDLRAGRIYLPAEDMRSHGCTEDDLRAGIAGPALRRLIAFEAGRVRALLDAGAPLVGTLKGAARVAVAGYVAGGRATMAAIAAADHDVLSATPRPGKGRTVTEMVSTYARAR
jgi:squalene synthase HpnC